MIKTQRNMDAFHHVQFMNSLIIGVGITKLLSDFGALLENNALSEVYIPNLIWAFFTFALSLVTWWLLWSYKLNTKIKWRFSDYLLLISTSIFLYLMNELILPASVDQGQKYFHSIARWYFLSFAFYLAMAITLRVKVLDMPPGHTSNLFRFIGLFIIVVTFMVYYSPPESPTTDTIVLVTHITLLAVFVCLYVHKNL